LQRDNDSNCPLLQRITDCANKGFSAVVLDDVSDQGDTPNGFNLTTADYRNHTSYLSSQAAALNMKVGIMGGADLISDTTWAAQFDFAVAVNCFAAGTCGAWSGFRSGEDSNMLTLLGDAYGIHSMDAARNRSGVLGSFASRFCITSMCKLGTSVVLYHDRKGALS
jgi:hypothetical protein